MDKNPSLARWIPGFMYRFLSRILRIDFMNDPIPYHHGYKKDVNFAQASIETFNVSLEVKGRNSNFFCKIANFRKFAGFKANLEMFFLPNESYKHRNKHFVITFGHPIDCQTFDSRFSPKEWAAHIKKYTYSPVEDPYSEFKYLIT